MCVWNDHQENTPTPIVRQDCSRLGLGGRVSCQVIPDFDVLQPPLKFRVLADGPLRIGPRTRVPFYRWRCRHHDHRHHPLQNYRHNPVQNRHKPLLLLSSLTPVGLVLVCA